MEEYSHKVEIDGVEFKLKVQIMDGPPTVQSVSDQPCPRCGARWGHEDPKLDFPNRIKVDDFWRCYNPDCEVGYYDPATGEIEYS